MKQSSKYLLSETVVPDKVLDLLFQGVRGEGGLNEALVVLYFYRYRDYDPEKKIEDAMECLGMSKKEVTSAIRWAQDDRILGGG